MVEAGDVLTDGSVNPNDILKIKGVKGVQAYMLTEVQVPTGTRALRLLTSILRSSSARCCARCRLRTRATPPCCRAS